MIKLKRSNFNGLTSGWRSVRAQAYGNQPNRKSALESWLMKPDRVLVVDCTNKKKSRSLNSVQLLQCWQNEQMAAAIMKNSRITIFHEKQ